VAASCPPLYKARRSETSHNARSTDAEGVSPASPALCEANRNSEIDPHAILHEAVDLARSGRHAESLQRHLWFHQHALEHKPSR
jgi:hypothetical protein